MHRNGGACNNTNLTPLLFVVRNVDLDKSWNARYVVWHSCALLCGMLAKSLSTPHPLRCPWLAFILVCMITIRNPNNIVTCLVNTGNHTQTFHNNWSCALTLFNPRLNTFFLILPKVPTFSPSHTSNNGSSLLKSSPVSLSNPFSATNPDP